VITIDRLHVRAAVDKVFATARDVTRWPDWLAHYRWVRFHQQRQGGGLVEMAAWRPFGPVNYPTWWLSEMDLEEAAPRIRFRHVDGITRGMDVAWDFVPSNGGTDVTITHWWNGPRWPLIGRAAATLVIGPVFVHGIASRTLAGIARQAEKDTT
jgi:ribosome-associated toxin RatA of RatAB toxin-antitoxin module